MDMVLSMTGYGKSAGTFEGKKIVVEIRSLNSKSLDLNLRLMPLYREKELDLRAIIGGHLDRGKVEVSISMENSGDSKNYAINRDLAQAYYNDIKAVAELVGLLAQVEAHGGRHGAGRQGHDLAGDAAVQFGDRGLAAEQPHAGGTGGGARRCSGWAPSR